MQGAGGGRLTFRTLLSRLLIMAVVTNLIIYPVRACTPPNVPNWKEVLKRQEQSKKAAANVILIGRFVRTLKNKIEHKAVYPQKVLLGKVKGAYLIPAPISTCGVYPPENTLIKLYLTGKGNVFGIVAYEKIK